jgi:hypothetical protein
MNQRSSCLFDQYCGLQRMMNLAAIPALGENKGLSGDFMTVSPLDSFKPGIAGLIASQCPIR